MTAACGESTRVKRMGRWYIVTCNREAGHDEDHESMSAGGSFAWTPVLAATKPKGETQ